MILKSSNFIYCLLIFSLYFTPLKSEEKIDIWNKQNNKESIDKKKKKKKKIQKK